MATALALLAPSALLLPTPFPHLTQSRFAPRGTLSMQTRMPRGPPRGPPPPGPLGDIGGAVAAGAAVVAAASFGFFFLALSVPLLLLFATAVAAAVFSVATSGDGYVVSSRTMRTELDEFGRPRTVSDGWIRTNDPELQRRFGESSQQQRQLGWEDRDEERWW